MKNIIKNYFELHLHQPFFYNKKLFKNKTTLNRDENKKRKKFFYCI